MYAESLGWWSLQSGPDLVVCFSDELRQHRQDVGLELISACLYCLQEQARNALILSGYVVQPVPHTRCVSVASGILQEPADLPIVSKACLTIGIVTG